MEEEYSRYVGMMYQNGYHVIDHSINSMSDEVFCFGNKILIRPTTSDNDTFVYIFTGNIQKRAIPSETTEFRLYLEDEKEEFKDNDNIMISVAKYGDIPVDLFTRSYAQWKFGVSFDKGIHMDSGRTLIFQTQKEITKFDIEINNIDLFVRKHKRRREDFNSEMTWLD